MPEIGETLREARMRRRIDMTEVEAATKIRAKYLRALENEEWELLPGSTFVKTFLRTYAEYLDLDPRVLVEEYRQRYERPSTQDLTPFGAGMGGQRRRRRQRRPVGPLIVGLLGVAALLGALYVLGVVWDGEPNDEQTPPDTVGVATATPTPTPRKKSSSRRKRKKPRARVTLRLTATDPVFVCLVDATGRAVVDGVNLAGGQRTRTFRSQRFRANFGNGNVRMTVGGRPFRAADIGRPVGYEFRPGRKPRRLAESVRTKLCAT
jgi:cytoskeleton protein RodZ